MHGIFETIERYRMIGEGMHVIAGVSGGADSVCLLHVLCEYRRQVPFRLTVVHVEHGLRGEESLADADFVRELCGRLEVPCRIAQIQAGEIARAEGLSVEEAARRERYRIFREIKEECAAERIAVAHNRNDQAETVLWNLARGSGLKGLGGMNPIRGDIIRPLLFTGREEIERILTEAGLAWRTDRTNLQQEYTRNRIRLSLLPQMEGELNARAAEHIADAAGRLRQVQEYLDHVTDCAAERCIRREGDSVCVDLRVFFEQETLIQEELLKRAAGMCGGLKDFGSVHLRALMELCGMGCGRRISLPGRLCAVREDGILRLFRKPDAANGAQRLCREESETLWLPGGPDVPDGAQRLSGEGSETLRLLRKPDVADDAQRLSGEESGTLWLPRKPDAADDAQRFYAGKDSRSDALAAAVEFPGCLRMAGWQVRTELLENSPELIGQIVEKKYTKWLSYDTIKDNVLLLRTRQPGDYLVVNREGGRKKLKDYLIDLKIPRERRDRILLLAAGSQVLWVIGYRISEAAKVTEDTKLVMKIQVEEGPNEREDTHFADRTGSQ